MIMLISNFTHCPIPLSFDDIDHNPIFKTLIKHNHKTDLFSYEAYEFK